MRLYMNHRCIVLSGKNSEPSASAACTAVQPSASEAPFAAVANLNPAVTKGCKTNQPTANGRAIRMARLCVNSSGRRRKYNIAEKKPANMKNVGSVKMWTNRTT